MSRTESVTSLISFNKLLQKLLINSGVTHSDNKIIDDAISKACKELGVMTADLQVVQVVKENNVKSYDIGFRDPNPQSRGDLISLTAARNREWTPFTTTPILQANPFEDET